MYGTDLGLNGAKAVHPSTLHMQNSCTPNTYYTIAATDHVIVIRARRDIKQGQPVTRCLTNVMKCNLFRSSIEMSSRRRRF